MEKYLDKNMVKFISKKNGNCSIFEAGSILHNAMVKKDTKVVWKNSKSLFALCTYEWHRVVVFYS